jgi:UDP-GlcNAc:undecaprenyl-phosphate/decaprenyl-phosphate GlcNAc-1-phosphate transferase
MVLTFLPLLLALFICILLIPLIKRFSYKLGYLAQPRSDRWHKSPTPIFGGIAIFFGFILSQIIYFSILGQWDKVPWGLLSGSVIIFTIGLYDDFHPISPLGKLLGQIVAAALVILLGYTSTFFNPRIENEIIAQLPNILFTFIWLVGITNAINLLDNMDGLAGGISLIAACILGFFFWREGNQPLFLVSITLAGSLLGFLFFNFPPASIFMGDSGSLFLGFTLAILAIAQQQQASNVFAVISVPTLLFLLPILDTLLVTITRLMRGQSPTHGGRDHTSHRLIAFGLNERQTLYILYAVALITGIMAAALESINYWMSLALVPILVIVLALLVAYLGRMKVVSNIDVQENPVIAKVIGEITYRRRLLEFGLDFFLISIAFYLSFLANYGLVMNNERLALYLQALPIGLASAYIVNFLVGVYRGVWRYVGLDDFVRYVQASIGCIAIFAGLLFLINSFSDIEWTNDFPSKIILFFGVFLFLSLSTSRSSFKFLDLLFSASQPRIGRERVVIYGASDSGEMAIRWMQMNLGLNYLPVGILADNPLLIGRRIHGVEVIGNYADLEKIITQGSIQGVIITEGLDEMERLNAVKNICKANQCWIKVLRLGFEDL